jgi:hypothetical protein
LSLQVRSKDGGLVLQPHRTCEYLPAEGLFLNIHEVWIWSKLDNHSD